MPVAWDTTLVSRLTPGSSALGLFESTLLDRGRVLIPAVSVMEVVCGHARASARRRRSERLLKWLPGFLARPDVGVLGFTRTAAFAVGEARARAPFPPSRRARDRRSKAERRVSWALDMQVAATAWAFGVPVATENVADFERLSELLAELYPRAKPLEVLPSPL